VTTSFLAKGGDGHLSAVKGFKTWQPEGQGSPVLRDIITQTIVATLAQRQAGQANIDTQDFPNLADQPLWTLAADVSTALDTVQIRGAGAYQEAGQPQLTRTAFTGHRYRGSAHAVLDTRRWAWQTDLDAQYARSEAEGGDPAESADLIRLSSLVKDRRWKKHGRLAPQPYVEISAESEFTKANPYEPSPEDFHHLLATGTAGLRLEPVAKVNLFIGAGVRSELFEPAPRGKFGLQVGYRISQLSLLSHKKLGAKFESSLEYFKTEPGSSRSVDRAIWTNKLSFQILGYLSAGLNLDAFLYRQGAVGDWASAGQLTATVGAAWGTRVQTH
jgi:hypothetical protein